MDQPATVRVKICGVTTPEDAVAAARAGADAVGLNFVAGPRQISIATAADILAALPPFCAPVALVDVSAGDLSAELLELVGRYWVSHLQLYGSVTPQTIARLHQDGFRTILARQVTDQFPCDAQTVLNECPPGAASAVLLDAHHPDKQGGSGQIVDWSLIRQARDDGKLDNWPPLVLAGGLTAENVAEAIRIVQPWAVDVSSGVESSPGRKDRDKVREFVQAAKGR